MISISISISIITIIVNGVCTGSIEASGALQPTQ